jgi:AAA+ ATPase superfamily predicted ATPase
LIFATVVAAMTVAATEVAKMKFYGREHELERIRKEFTKLRHRSSIIVVVGRRRIGKTRLVFEAHKDKPFLYFFVGKKKMPDLLAEWSDEIESRIGKVYGELKNFSHLVEYLFNKAKEKEITVFFDEVQNFLTINPAAFSDLQKHYDINRETSSLLLVFAGSSYSLVEKIFTGSVEPLFGRATEFIRLSHLSIKTQKEILVDTGLYSAENLLHTFSIFDGIPRFYEEILETGKKEFKNVLKELIIDKEFLWEEGFNMMREEFGKDYSIYHSILSSIAVGKRSRNEIEQSIQGSAGGYLHNLEKVYGLVKKESPIFSKATKINIQRYYFADNFYEFWFHFISRYQYLKEINKKKKAFEKIWALLPEYEGYKFEALIKRIFIEINPFNIEFTRIGRYWDRKGENEIDIVMVDEESRTAYLVEVKRNLKKTLKEEEKIKFYNKAAAIPPLKGYNIRYLFAGIENHQIVILENNTGKFVL